MKAPRVIPAAAVEASGLKKVSPRRDSGGCTRLLRGNQSPDSVLARQSLLGATFGSNNDTGLECPSNKVTP